MKSEHEKEWFIVLSTCDSLLSIELKKREIV